MNKSLEVDTVAIQPETAAVSLQKEPPDIREEDIYKSTYSGAANKYYVITGCFMMPEFAERYAEKMRSMGYTTEIILRDDGFHMVSVGSFGNLRASLDNLGSVRADITPKAWVYKKR